MWFSNFWNVSSPQDECSVRRAMGPSVLKEELFVLAAQIRIHLVIQHLHRCLKAPSLSCQPKTTPSSHLLIISQKLLASSAGVIMSDSDRAFIHWCLRDCLWCVTRNIGTWLLYATRLTRWTVKVQWWVRRKGWAGFGGVVIGRKTLLFLMVSMHFAINSGLLNRFSVWESNCWRK